MSGDKRLRLAQALCMLLHIHLLFVGVCILTKGSWLIASLHWVKRIWGAIRVLHPLGVQDLLCCRLAANVCL